ncbi:MAG: aminotransferase class I/II-fold pyridoxal phosphate-dependent enzyme [Anaerolineae bacterium]|jgi:glutamate/tyrosine decarboxylase-like PLP-dependent enzyme|nr:aminotransferase class I/II-fold pyridoxal phosphate-dependent enzyme [Anaerolineae bacterium]
MIELTPEEFRLLAHRAVDQIADQLAHIRDLPTRQPTPVDLRERLIHAPLPETPIDPEVLLQRVFDEILPYPMGNNSPRFFAWVNSPAAPLGIIAELLAAAHNPSVAGGEHSATYVEHGVLNWFKAIFGYDPQSAGLLTSGGSVANLIPLTVMRHVKTGGVVRTQGMSGTRLIVYTSTQAHSSIQKAIELLGIGTESLRKVPTHPDYTIDLDALRVQIAQDRVDGLSPACIVANAGTVNTGAIDPLDALADLCQQEDLWLHIDGAYGGIAILSQPDLYRGIHRADSIAVDPHKWMYVPIECGCALVRDGEAMRAAFSVLPPYLRDDRALPWFSEFGIQQTRTFRALKLWMVMQQIGLDGYRTLIQRDIDLSQSLQVKIRARSDFELCAAGPLSICCFLYHPTGVSDVSGLNRALLTRVQADGRMFLTGTELDGRYVLRVCIVNFRTTEDDLTLLLDVIAEKGQEVLHNEPH